MSYLYQALSDRVDAWRTANYPCDDYPAIREILEFAVEDVEGGQLRYLRSVSSAMDPDPRTGMLVVELVAEILGQLYPSSLNERQS